MLEISSVCIALDFNTKYVSFNLILVSDPCDSIFPKPLALNKDYPLYIMSPINKNHTDSWIQCAWHLKVDNGSRIEMTAVNFNLETS